MEQETVHPKEFIFAGLLVGILLVISWFYIQTQAASKSFRDMQAYICAEQPPIEQLPQEIAPTSIQTKPQLPKESNSYFAGQSGTCRAIVHGQFYIESSLGKMCRQHTGYEISYCVTDASLCTPASCLDEFTIRTQTMLTECALTTEANLDMNNSCMTCEIYFEPGQCDVSSATTQCVDRSQNCESDFSCQE